MLPSVAGEQQLLIQSLLDGIHSRSSIGKLRNDEIDEGLVEQLVHAAIQAPNHRLTEPWRFHVLRQKAREELGKIMERVLVQQKPDADEAAREIERAKPLRAPLIIAVTSSAGKDEIETIENQFATAAAIQNMLLAAHGLGLGAQWRTGNVAYSSELKAWLGLGEGDSVVGLVYVGYPDMEPKPRRRAPAADKIVWR